MATLVASAQWTDPAHDIPAYNVGAPSKPLPAIMSGSQLTGPYFQHAYQVTAYKMAAQVSKVLHQEPCYCRCDREMGHNSLHSCFEGTHGAACSTCMREAVYTYQQTKKGQHRRPDPRRHRARRVAEHRPRTHLYVAHLGAPSLHQALRRFQRCRLSHSFATLPSGSREIFCPGRRNPRIPSTISVTAWTGTFKET